MFTKELELKPSLHDPTLVSELPRNCHLLNPCSIPSTVKQVGELRLVAGVVSIAKEDYQETRRNLVSRLRYMFSSLL